MCEQSEVQYLDGDVVWVKLGPCWWPGEVCDPAKLPPEITQSLKKPPIAIVKFFQEDTYEYVKNLNQIYKYNCRKKNEFIKKGLDMHRAKITFMDKFPADVCHAETLTGGDPDIITSDMFAPEEKPSYAAIFGTPTKKSPKVTTSNKGRTSLSSVKSSKMPMISPQKRITHPRFVGKSDHEVRILEQSATTPSPTAAHYECHICGFVSSRLNVIVLHNKSHSNGTLDTLAKNKAKPKPRLTSVSTSPKKNKRPKSFASTRSIDEDIELIRQGLSLSANDSTESESEPEQGKKSSPKRKNKAATQPNKKQKVSNIANNLLADWGDSDEESSATAEKTIATSGTNEPTTENSVTNNLHSELLADWEDKTSDEQSVSTESPPHKPESPPAPAPSEKEKEKTLEEKSSCFDFKDEEDSEVLEKSPGRKIPRVIPHKRLSLDIEIKAKRDSRRNTAESAPDIPENRSELSTKSEVNLESIENILKVTAVPEVPDLPDTKVSSSKKNKNKKQDADMKTNGAIRSSERGQASTELDSGNLETVPPQLPKKRIVRNFEEFENLLNEQKQAEEESARSRSTLEVSKLKSQLMSKLNDTPPKEESAIKDLESKDDCENKPETVSEVILRTESEESLNEMESLEDKSDATYSEEILNDEICKKNNEKKFESVVDTVRKDTESSQSTFVSEDEAVEDVSEKNTGDSKFEENSVKETEREEAEVCSDSILPETFRDEKQNEECVVEIEEKQETREPIAEIKETDETELQVQTTDEEKNDSVSKPSESCVDMTENSVKDSGAKEGAEEPKTILETTTDVCADTAKIGPEPMEIEPEITDKEGEPMDVEAELPETKILTNEDAEESPCNLEADATEQVTDSANNATDFEQAETKHEESRKEIFSEPKQDEKTETSEPADLPGPDITGEYNMDMEDQQPSVKQVSTEHKPEEVVPPFPDPTDATRSQKMLVDISDICIDNTDNMSGLSTLAAVSELTGSRYEKPEVSVEVTVDESQIEQVPAPTSDVEEPPPPTNSTLDSLHGPILSTDELPLSETHVPELPIPTATTDPICHKPLATLANFSMDFSDSNSESTIIKDVSVEETSTNSLTPDTLNVPNKENLTTVDQQITQTEQDKSIHVNDVTNDFEAIENEIEKITSLETQSDKLNSFPENISQPVPDTSIVETTDITYQHYGLVETDKPNEIVEEFVEKVEEIPVVTQEPTLESEIAKLTDTQPGVEDVLHEHQQNTSSSKLLEILTDSKTGTTTTVIEDDSKTQPTAQVTKTIISSPTQKVHMVIAGDCNMPKKFDPKTSKYVIKSTVSKSQSSGKSNKPIILSEKIIKPVTETENVSVKKVTSKRSYQDVEDIDTFIIQKPSKKPNLPETEQQDIILTPKTEIKGKGGTRSRGKPKIIEQTIIKAADVVTQPAVSEPQSLLDDTMFDINSMPIVLTDQILTPESIENMPVVMTDIIPGSSSSSGIQAKVSDKSTSAATPPPPMKRGGTLQQVKLLNKAKPSTTQSEPAPKINQNVVKTFLQRGGLGKNQKVYQTASSKLLKSNTAVITQPGKPGKFIILPNTTASSTGSKYTVGKRLSAVKGIAATSSTAASGTKLKTVQNAPVEPTGNKIMIVTNQQGVQSRVLLTPAQQKLLGCKVPANKLGKGGATSPQKGGLLHKSILTSKGTILTPVNSPGVVTHKSPTAIITSKSQLFSSTSGQTLVTSEGQVLSPITQQQMKALKPDSHKLGKKVQLQQSRVLVSEKAADAQKAKVNMAGTKTKTILIKGSQGQTVKKLQTTTGDSSKTMVMATQSTHKTGQLVSMPSGKQVLIASKSANASSKTDMKGVTTSSTVGKQLSDKMQKLQVAKQAVSTSSRVLQKPSSRTQMILNQATNKSLSSGSSVPPLAPITSATSRKTDGMLAHKQVELKVTSPDGKDTKGNDTVVSTLPTPEQKQPNQLIIQDAMGNQTTVTEGQILALPSGDTVDGQPQSYVLVTVDESGHLVPISNDTLMSLDPSLGLSGDVNNIVLQIDQGATDAAAADTKAEAALPSETHTFPTGAQSTLDTGEQQQLLSMDNQQLILAEQSVVGATPTTTEAQGAVTPTDGQQQLFLDKEPTQETFAEPTVESATVVPGASSDASGLVQDTHTVACSISSGESSQQLIITGDPESTQKFLASLSDGNTDLSSLLSSTDGNIIINADGQQILLNTDSDNQILLSVNSDEIGLIQPSTEADAAQGSLYGAQQAMKNQDILAAALADTDVFQQEQAAGDNKVTVAGPLVKASSAAPAQLSPNSTLYPMNVGNVLETSLTLGSPIMTPLEVPSVNNKKISNSDIESALITQVPSSLELPITITDPSISQTVSQQVMLGNELQNNLDLPITISDSTISAIRSTEMSSPSFVYSLPSLDEGAELEQKRSFAESTPPSTTTDSMYNASLTGSMPILTEEPELTVAAEPPTAATDETIDQHPPSSESSVVEPTTVTDTPATVTTTVTVTESVDVITTVSENVTPTENITAIENVTTINNVASMENVTSIDTVTTVETVTTIENVTGTESVVVTTATNDTETAASTAIEDVFVAATESESCTTFSAITTPTTTISEKITSELQIDDLDLHSTDICSSLSEPPPGMFDKSSFGLDTLSYLANKVREEQTIPLENESNSMASEVPPDVTCEESKSTTSTEPLTSLRPLAESIPTGKDETDTIPCASTPTEQSLVDKVAAECALELEQFGTDETVTDGTINDSVITQDLPRSDLSETPNSELNSPRLDIDENSTEIPIQPTIITNLSDNFDENNTSPEFSVHKDSKKRIHDETDEDESEIKKSKISFDCF